MKVFRTRQDIERERIAHRGTKIYELLGVLLSDIDRLPNRHDPTEEEIYALVNKMYNNAKEMMAYNPESVIEEEYFRDYIKKQLTDAEVVEIIMQAKEDGLKNKGDFMRLFSMRYKGQYDGRTVSMVVDQLLKQ
jgi:uncharacterized protein YqeY